MVRQEQGKGNLVAHKVGVKGIGIQQEGDVLKAEYSFYFDGAVLGTRKIDGALDGDTVVEGERVGFFVLCDVGELGEGVTIPRVGTLVEGERVKGEAEGREVGPLGCSVTAGGAEEVDTKSVVPPVRLFTCPRTAR